MVTIYKLGCIHTGEAYIGCTAGKIGKRMREHRCLLNGNKHKAARLQALWNQYGSSGFRLDSLETLPKTADVIQKRKREIFWMEHYDKDGKLLNHCKASFAPPEGAQALGAKQRVANGYRPSAESNEKRRLAQLGKPKGHGAKISAAKKGAPVRKKACELCGREIYISNYGRHVAACKAKNGE
jgi:hypothetical protein